MNNLAPYALCILSALMVIWFLVWMRGPYHIDPPAPREHGMTAEQHERSTQVWGEYHATPEPMEFHNVKWNVIAKYGNIDDER